jgi:hypothetical protein
MVLLEILLVQVAVAAVETMKAVVQMVDVVQTPLLF